MLGSNGICRDTKKNIVSMQPVVVWERDEKGVERREDGGKKDRQIPETTAQNVFSRFSSQDYRQSTNKSTN